MKKSIQIALLLSCFISFSQIPENIKPPSWKMNANSISKLKPFNLPAFNVEKLLEEDKINDKDKSIPWRFGHEIYVDHDINNVGQWQTLPNGDRIWRMSYISKGAYSLNFMFDNFKIPKGAKLYVYSNDKKDLLRPFTHHNNNPKQVLGTWLVEGSQAWIEYYQPANVIGDMILNIGSVIHGYRTGKNYMKGLGNSGDCNQDVDCDISPSGADPYNLNAIKESVKSAGAMLLSGGSFCSGTLVNNTNNDGTPYIITADHCGGDPSNWAFRFNWRSPNPSCSTTASSPNGSYDQTTSGAISRMSSPKSDSKLIEATDTSFFTDNSDLVFAGWNRSKTEVPNANFCVSHPKGDIQKVAADFDGATRVTQNFNVADAAFWRIEAWELGVTEPGSSGSALFNESGQIIGMLTYGQAACSGTSNNGQFDAYGRFGVAWDYGSSASTRLKDWLDPAGTNPETLDQYPSINNYVNDSSVSLDSNADSEICGTNFTPNIIIYNHGSETLTSALIKYNLEGGTDTNYNWTGSLEYGESEMINLPTYSNLSQGNHVFSVSVFNPNGNTDENLSNNNHVFNFSVLEAFETQKLIFKITTDDYGTETTWEFKDENGTIIENGPTTAYSNSTNYEEILTIPSDNSCYSFTIIDSQDDGICCQYGSGSYTIEDDEGNVIVSGGEFDSSETSKFFISRTLNTTNFNLKQAVRIYPNPVTNILNVELRDIEMANYTISNVIGQVISNSRLHKNTTNKINIESLTPGIYLFTIISKNAKFTQKIIKK